VISADDDRGSGDALGLVLMFPVMLGLAVLILFLGRQVDTRSQVQAAADAAAQSAVLQREPGAALAAASRTAAAMLTDATACAGGARVAISADAWQAGGRVTVTVACTPAVDDLALIRPPARTFTASSIALIDLHRAPWLP
jgi:Flp pilus assembly protein TadG